MDSSSSLDVQNSENSVDTDAILCEGDDCKPGDSPVSYCPNCNLRLCDVCWDRQQAHRKKSRGPQVHEKENPLLHDRFHKILHASSDDNAHILDERTKWLGWRQNGSDTPVLEEFDAYTDIVTRNIKANSPEKYPQLVSFVGETGAGKSTLIRMLIESCRLSGDEFPTPVVDASNDTLPISADVHLYADPDSYDKDQPILYVDCEGLKGGDLSPMANRRREPDDHDPLITASRVRVLQWARPDSLSKPPSRMQPGVSVSDRRFAVGHLYPRVLYAFSAVVVYVCKNPKTFQDALYNLIEWGANSLETSVNQPTLPHVILALNAVAPSRKNPDDEWDTNKTRDELLALVNDLPTRHAQKLMADLNVSCTAGAPEAGTTEPRDQTIQDLILRYYSSFTVVRLPAATDGRYSRLNTQLGKLRQKIQDGCEESNKAKQKAHMLLEAQTFNVYLRSALDHFTQKLNEPFNFVRVSLRLNPIPQNFANHVVRLALCICDARDRAKDEDIYNTFTELVASCVVLDVVRVRKQGWATDSEIFRQYQSSFEDAFTTFCDKYWPCGFSKGDRHCVNVKLIHGLKGHQDCDGRIIQRGDYQPDPRFSSSRVDEWIDLIRKAISSIQDDLKTRLSFGPTREGLDDIWPLHSQKIDRFLQAFHLGWPKFFSQTTCLGCLATAPEHPLACGHVLCTKCVQAQGNKLHTYNEVTLTGCPLHASSSGAAPEVHVIRFKPEQAGVRLLSLDGGGVLAIAELEVLRALQRELPSEIPIQAFFDLMVGSGAGAILALSLGVREKTVGECLEDQDTFRDNAFRPRVLFRVPGISKLVPFRHRSVLKTTPLYETLKTSLGCTALFGRDEPGRTHSNVKVAVTATDQITRKPVLLANYSHSGSVSGDYELHRPDDRGSELQVWEAGAAASAFPRLFKSFTHSRTHRSYLDGTLRYNNPIQLVDAEMRRIWTDVAAVDPDLLLSIGSGYNGTEPVSPDDRISPTTHSSRKGPKFWESRLPDIPDAESMWQDFLVSDRENAARQLRERYVRINPRLSIDPSHGTNAMKHFDRIQRQTQSYLDTQLTVIDRIVMNLVASLFFFTASTLPVPTGEGSGYKITGKVVCRLRERKDYIRALGTFLVQRQRSGVKLSLEVRECTCGESGNTIQKIELEETVERMISGRDPYVIIRNLAVSTKNAQVDMSLLLTSPGKPLNRYSLSRFPRRIMLDDSELRINGTAETEDSTLADLTDAEDELSQQTSYIATSSDSESVPVHEPLADMSLLLRHTGAVFPSLLSLVPSMIE